MLILITVISSQAGAQLICTGQLTRDGFYQSEEFVAIADKNSNFRSETGEKQIDNLKFAVFLNKTDRLLYLSVSEVGGTVILSTTLENPRAKQNLELKSYINGNISLSCKF